MAKFKIGQIANHIHGFEVEILELPRMQITIKENGGIKKSTNPCYTTKRVATGYIGWAHEDYLRKKQPPKEDKHKDRDKVLDRGDMDTNISWNDYYKGIERELDVEKEKETVE